MRGSWGRAAAVVAALLMLSGPARAHVGPPFPIVENQRAGPYVVSVWAHPDLGTGAFYIFLEAPPGATLPEENEVQVSVQPLTGRLPEATYAAARQDVPDRVQYYAEAEFDRQELWRVRVRVSGAAGSGEVLSQVEPTPTTYGRWDLLIYSFPFVLFGLLGLLAVVRRWRRKAAELPASPPGRATVSAGGRVGPATGEGG